MNRIQAEQTVTEYLKKLYSFALKKTVNLQDAEDLTQEIAMKLYKALLVKDIVNVNAYVWRVAQNTLVNYYRGKSRSIIGICIDEFAEALPGSEDIADRYEKSEIIRRLQSEIAFLSKTQRKIVILYYFENKKLTEIAKLLDIPVGTVKWHLFEAKKEIKKGMVTMRTASELKFNPIKFTIMGLSGSVGSMGETSNFFRSALSQNIAYCVYREAKTVNEIADCLGVSPVYIESEVEFLEEYSFLIKKGNKYLANFLIDEPNEKVFEIIKLQEDMYTKTAKTYANELYDTLCKSDLIHADGLYYPNNDINFLMWSILFYIAAVSGEKLMDNNISFDEAATIRSDGAKNIAYAGIENLKRPKQKYIDSMKKWCGPCWNSNDKYILWQIDSEWSEKRVNDQYHEAAIRALSLFRRFLANNHLSCDEYAYMAERGYFIKGEKQNAKVDNQNISALQIVWIKNNETKQKLISIGDRIKEKYIDEFCKLKTPFIQAVLSNTPDHLKKMRAFGLQHIFYSDGWFLLYCAKELVNNGKLKLPTEEQRKSLTTLLLPNK